MRRIAVVFFRVLADSAPIAPAFQGWSRTTARDHQHHEQEQHG